MNREQFIAQLEAVLELVPGTYCGSQALRDLKHWDSLKLLEIVALADEQFQLQIDVSRLAQCDTIEDLVKLVEGTTAPSV